jgi:hypothetical protein
MKFTMEILRKIRVFILFLFTVAFNLVAYPAIAGDHICIEIPDLTSHTDINHGSEEACLTNRHIQVHPISRLKDSICQIASKLRDTIWNEYPLNVSHEDFMRSVKELTKDLNLTTNELFIDTYRLRHLHNLSDDEILSLSMYSSYLYDNVNTSLRQGGHKKAAILPFLAVMIHAIDKLPPYEGTVYRQTDLPPDISHQHSVGQIVTYPAFTSSSSNTVGWTGSHKMTIFSKTGRFIAPYSQHPKESEIIFKPGSKFKVIERRTDGKFTYVTVEEILP